MIYLTLENLVHLNKRINEMVGKGQNKINRAKLEAIVNHAKKARSIKEAAKIYYSGIIIDHPFYGGNKRTASIATQMFLELNGAMLDLSTSALIKLGPMVRSGKISEQELSKSFDLAIKIGNRKRMKA